MKKTFEIPFRVLASGIVLFGCLKSATLHAQNYYWDINGATAGAGGTTPSGIWENANWTTDSTGSSAPINLPDSVFPRFAAGTDATGNYTVTANADHTILGMLHSGNGGTVTISGTGVLTIGGGAQQGFFGGTGGFIRINNKLTGTGGVVSQSGQIYLDGDNDYSGGTTPGAGLINFNNAHSFGTGNFLLSASGGAMIAEGSSAINIANNWTVSLATVNLNCVGNAAGITYSGNVNLGANALNIGSGGGTTFVDIFSGVISGTGSFGRQAQSTAGIVKLTGANTYSGKTTLSSGATWVSSINSVAGGTASSSLGAPTTVANGTIALGSTTLPATLVYTGAGESSDRVLNLAGTTGGGVIQNNGTGALIFTSDLTATGAGAKSLTLGGSNTDGNRINGKIVNSSSATSLVKSDAGSWTLGGANTYTGTTTINAGTLSLDVANAIRTSSGLVMTGGTFKPGGFSQDLSLNTTLTITTGTSTLDLSGGDTFTWFKNSAGASWTGILNIINANSDDMLRFGTDSTGLTMSQLARIEFDGSGLGTAQIDSLGFVAVPEPSTIALMIMGAAGVFGSLKRRKS